MAELALVCGTRWRFCFLHRLRVLTAATLLLSSKWNFTWRRARTPQECLSSRYWHISSTKNIDKYICQDEMLHRNALGLLRAHIHLLRCEIDFDLALEDRLLLKIHHWNMPLFDHGFDSESDNSTENDSIIASNNRKGDLTWPNWQRHMREFSTM